MKTCANVAAVVSRVGMNGWNRGKLAVSECVWLTMRRIDLPRVPTDAHQKDAGLILRACAPIYL